MAARVRLPAAAAQMVEKAVQTAAKLEACEATGIPAAQVGASTKAIND